MFTREKKKVFCIGLNKTGTTSLKVTLKELGYKVGDQKKAERLIGSYQKRNFKKIVEYTKTAEAFQDFPFSAPFTFMFLDQFFPGSKFILSIRDSGEEWYESITRFHSKFLKLSYTPPKWEDLRDSDYVDKGWLWETQKALFQIEKEDPYNKKRLIYCYEKHNSNVLDYFTNKNNLLVINVKEKNAITKLTAFLGVKSDLKELPWENKT